MIIQIGVILNGATSIGGLEKSLICYQYLAICQISCQLSCLNKKKKNYFLLCVQELTGMICLFVSPLHLCTVSKWSSGLSWFLEQGSTIQSALHCVITRLVQVHLKLWYRACMTWSLYSSWTSTNKSTNKRKNQYVSTT